MKKKSKTTSPTFGSFRDETRRHSKYAFSRRALAADLDRLLGDLDCLEPFDMPPSDVADALCTARAELAATIASLLELAAEEES